MGNSVVTKDSLVTPTSDTNGIKVSICNPDWFDKGKKFTISNAPERTANIEFTGSDLNFVARVLYAESSGSESLTDKTERLKEKEAILNVKHFRLNRPGYPSNRFIAKTFTEVCQAPGQFESVFAGAPKFTNSAENTYVKLSNKECSDLQEALDALRSFLASGPNPDYLHDNFRGGAGRHGKTIGLSRFWLSTTGKEMAEKVK